MTDFKKKLNQLKMEKWLCIAAVMLLVCTSVPDEDDEYWYDNGSSNDGGGYDRCAANPYDKGCPEYVDPMPNSYTVKFDLQDGNFITPQTIEHGGKATAPSIPTRTGYTFGGWYRDAEYYYLWDFNNYVVTSDTTLYAKWNPNTYTITYNANGGTGAPDAQTKTYDVPLILSGAKPTLTGHTFLKWNTEQDGTGDVYSARGSYTTDTAVTLYAQWGETGTFTYSGRTYKTIKIGSQTWMAENLNYVTESGSTCYDCGKYGRLYVWEAAMTACPTDLGWHLPNYAEWTTLVNYVGGVSTAGTKLKSTSGWNDNYGNSGNGTDEFGFSALPGGAGNIADGNIDHATFQSAGEGGHWWSATGYSPLYDGANHAYVPAMHKSGENVYMTGGPKSSLYSVRCVAD